MIMNKTSTKAKSLEQLCQFFSLFFIWMIRWIIFFNLIVFFRLKWYKKLIKIINFESIVAKNSSFPRIKLTFTTVICSRCLFEFYGPIYTITYAAQGEMLTRHSGFIWSGEKMLTKHSEISWLFKWWNLYRRK